jgi:hypothetical protein
MMNTYQSYNPPHLTDCAVWLNLDPNLRDYTSGTSNIKNWKNALDVSDVYTNTNSARRPLDTGTSYSFDGGDWLSSGTDRVFDTSATGWAVVFRYFCDDWTVSDSILGDDTSNNFLIKNNGATGIAVKAHNGSAASNKGLAYDTPGTLTNGQYYNILLTCDTTGEMFCWIDGVKQSATPNFPDNTYDLTLDEVGAKNGNTMQLTGDIQELMLYNAYLDDTKAANVSAYLNNKF